MIKAILACDDQGGVGKNGTLPWPKNSDDLRWFKENTAGHVVVMGSETWNDDFMPAPLRDRINVVVSRKGPEQYEIAHRVICGDIPLNLIELQAEFDDQDIWVIGGPNVIEQSLWAIDEFYISRIPGNYDCDRFLPIAKIETMFELYWELKRPSVTFEKWTKRAI